MHLEKFNLNLLVALDAILTSRSVTEAGKQLNMTQPGVSIALRKLREYFEDDLIAYTSQGAQLTPLAEDLKPRLAELIQRLRDTLKLRPGFDPALSSQHFRIMTSDVFEMLFLNNTFRDVANVAPGVQLTALPFRFEPLPDIFRDNVDMVITLEHYASDAHPLEVLYEDSFSCIVWEHNSKVGDELTPELYRSLDKAALYNTEGGQVERIFPGHDAVLDIERIKVRASSYSALPFVVTGTDLVSTVVTRFANYCAERFPVKVFPLPVSQPEFAVVAQWPSIRARDPSIHWLLQMIKAGLAAPGA